MYKLKCKDKCLILVNNDKILFIEIFNLEQWVSLNDGGSSKVDHPNWMTQETLRSEFKSYRTDNFVCNVSDFLSEISTKTTTVTSSNIK